MNLREAIEHWTKKKLTDVGPRRGHLGASQIGDKCARAAWYGFRWYDDTQHEGRILRLFERGHEEEFRFVRWLRMLPGVEVRDYATRLVYAREEDTYHNLSWDDPVPASVEDVSQDACHIQRATRMGCGPRQYNFQGTAASTLSHFSGSCDGMIRGIGEWEPECGDDWGLLEFKTHSEQSFKDVVKNGVRNSKPTHFAQMQIYMFYLDLPWGVYMAVNKNNDAIYTEVVQRQSEVAEQLTDKAQKIIDARHAPPRISDDPTWFGCRFCNFRELCHFNTEPPVNCRTCKYSQPAPEGEFYCNYYRDLIPFDFQQKGCSKHEI